MSFKDSIPELANNLHRLTDPTWQAKTEETAKKMKPIKAVAIAAIVAAVALLILGIALVATGNLGGIAAMVLSLPLLFIGINGFQLSSNLERIIKNPHLVRNMGGFGNQTDPEKLRQVMKKGTFGVDCLINSMVKDIGTQSINLQ